MIASGKVAPARVSAICAVLLISCALFIPLPRNVAAPALISASDAGRVFNHIPGKVESVNVEVGQLVKAGEVLVRLSVPELDYNQALLELELKDLRHRFQHKTGWQDKQGHSDISPAHIASKQAELKQIIQQKERLALRAPYDATVVTLPDAIQAGSWVSANTVLAEFVATGAPEIRAYLPASKLAYIDDVKASFVTASGTSWENLKLKSVSSSNIDVLADTVLSTQMGGPIATRQQNNGEFSMLQGWHLVTFEPDETALQIAQELTGFAKIETEPHSMASSAFRRVYGVFLRESGF